MENQKMIILDFSSGEVHIVDYDSEKYPEASDYVAADPLGLSIRPSDCQYMTIVGEVKINIH